MDPSKAWSRGVWTLVSSIAWESGPESRVEEGHVIRLGFESDLRIKSEDRVRAARKCVNENDDEDDENDDDDEKESQVTNKLTKMKKIRIVTQKVRKLILGINARKEVVNDLNSAWEEQVELETLRQGLLKNLRLELLIFCDTCICIA